MGDSSYSELTHFRSRSIMDQWMDRWITVITWPPPKICQFTWLSRFEWIANEDTCRSKRHQLGVDQTPKEQKLFSCAFNLGMHYVIVLAHNQVSCRHRTLPQSFWRGHGWLVSVTASIVCWGLLVQMRWKRRRCAARMHPTCGHNMPYAFSISGIINERVSYSCCSTCNTTKL